ncbi:hypothetical protein PHMEG_00037237, partial [Phytophthora megakarya]
SPHFPSPHINNGTHDVIRERRQKLADFLVTIVKVYTHLEVLLKFPGYPHLQNVFLHLQRFLDVPPPWKSSAISEGPYIPKCVRRIPSAVYSKMVKLRCGHSFHDDCVESWLRFSVTCPVCRRALHEKLSGTLTYELWVL